MRGHHLVTTSIVNAIGIVLNGLLFYWLKNSTTFIHILIPILVVDLLMLVFYIEETPFDLIID